MENIIVFGAELSGSIQIPPSKSHTMRAILFASMADGVSQVTNFLPSTDTTAMLQSCKKIGASIYGSGDQLAIEGVSGCPQVPDDVIDAQNSGQILYFIGAVASLIKEGHTVITGDESIRMNRPIHLLLSGLRQLGAYAISTRDTHYAPIVIKGKIRPGLVKIEGEASLPVSALLIASSFLKGETEIQITNPGEKPWVNLTLSWLQRGQVQYKNDNFEKIIVSATGRYKSFNYAVPSDFSSAAYPIAAALVTNSEITLLDIDMEDVQGDKKLIYVLQKMGANIEYDSIHRYLHIKRTQQLNGITIDINDFIDSITLLAVIGCYANGETVITGAEASRRKECNRISAICQELKKMGANITETRDGLIVKKSKLTAACVDSHSDHRMALSLIVAGMIADGKTTIKNTKCINKSFPKFVQLMNNVGANLQETNE